MPCTFLMVVYDCSPCSAQVVARDADSQPVEVGLATGGRGQ
jgi:hypothetical protein